MAKSGGIAISPNVADPMGGVAAFSITNTSQTAQSITQTLNVPAGYQYCLSLYAKCATPTTLKLSRQGPTLSHTDIVSVGTNLEPSWYRAGN